MVQTRQGVRSTKPKPTKFTTTELTATEPPIPLLPCIPSSKTHIYEESIRKMYTYDFSCLPIRERSGNQYIMIAFHCNNNTILNPPFKTRGDNHRISAYNYIIQQITSRNHKVDIQVLDNEVNEAYKKAITETWKARYQLVPPHVHFRNASERAIRTFNAHFIFVLGGVDPRFPGYLWDTLFPQAKLLLNIQR